MAGPKESYIRSQMRKKRTRPQAESDWKASQRMKKKARKNNPRKTAKKKAVTRKSGSPAKRRKTTTARTRRSNDSGGPVSVLVMNPYGGKKVAKKRRRKTTRRKRKTTTRRRRRNNPQGGWDLLGVAIAMVGGAGVAGATFLLDGTSVKLDYQNIGVALGSAGAGMALSKHAPNLAKGLAATGFGVGVLGLLRSHVMPPLGESRVTREKGEKEDVAAIRANLGRTNQALMMNAVKAQLGCKSDASCDSCRDFRRCRMSELLNLKGLAAVRAELPAKRSRPARRQRRDWSAATPGMLGDVGGM